METQKLTEILKKEFIGRCQRNEKYSLRSYARNLNIDHSLLAKILKNQKNLSKKMAFLVGQKLGLSSTLIQEMMEVNQDINQSHQISEDVFIMMSDWYHFAILELVKTDKFKYSPKSIAKTFGVTLFEIEQAFCRLQRLGFLIVNKDHSVTLMKPNNNWFNHKETNEARKIMQKQFLKKALESIDGVEFSKRANYSLTISLNNKDLSRFKKHILKFVDEVDREAEKINQKKEIYQLCVALFPLTN